MTDDLPILPTAEQALEEVRDHARRFMAKFPSDVDDWFLNADPETPEGLALVQGRLEFDIANGVIDPTFHFGVDRALTVQAKAQAIAEALTEVIVRGEVRYEAAVRRE